MPKIDPDTLTQLQSLSSSELTRALSSMPRHKQIEVLRALSSPTRPATKKRVPKAAQTKKTAAAPGPKTERDEKEYDRQRKAAQRHARSGLIIPEPANLVEREKCLADPERFLLRYGSADPQKPLELQDGKFWMPFARHHYAMISAIWERAISGGDKAVAAPRSDGKSTIIKWMLIVIMFARLRMHPCGIGQTRDKAREKLFEPVKYELQHNDLLAADFPAICIPLRKLIGGPSAGNKQHVNGVYTRAKCDQKLIRFPVIDGIPPEDDYGGMTLQYYGFDAAIRGARHDFAVIDDPETREVAFSQPTGRDNKAQHHKIEEIVDGDVAGLAFPNSTIPRIVITTIQNRRCFSYRVTSREVKEGGRPTFEGDRYGLLAQMPDRLDMWDEYIALRKQAQANGDKDGKPAYQFYLDNREAMDAGAVVSNPHRFDSKNEYEISALQAFFNRVADWGRERAMAELQNAPEVDVVEDKLSLTSGIVMKRMSGLQRDELPSRDGAAIDCKVAFGLDVGKYLSHWVKVAAHGNCIAHVIDYGTIETEGLGEKSEPTAIELAIIESLMRWRANLLASAIVPEFGLMDAGAYTQAVYEFVRRAGGLPFACSMGYAQSRFRMPKPDASGRYKSSERCFEECYARFQPAEQLWLYAVQVEYWKHKLQQQWLTPTRDNNGEYNVGSLSLFVPEQARQHFEFAEHQVSESREEIFVPDRGLKVEWKEHSRQNHYLDAMALAMAALGVLGVRLIPREVAAGMQARGGRSVKRPARGNGGGRFRRREGKWIPDRRNSR